MKTALSLFIMICFGNFLAAQKNDDIVYYKDEVAEMPRFPGCEKREKSSMYDTKEDLLRQKTGCANREFSAFIYKNLVYPQAAKAAKIQGKCVVDFIVEKDGRLSNIELVKALGGGCGEEALRLVNLVNKREILWRAGRLNKRKKARVAFSQTIYFYFDENPTDTIIYKIVQEMPRFPGCENNEGPSFERTKCAERKLLAFIQDNLEYPDIAWENDITGRCYVTFVVEKNGFISNIELMRDIGGECGKEALRVVGLMQDQDVMWIPGKQRGRTVRVQFNLPVHFRIEYEDD